MLAEAKPQNEGRRGTKHTGTILIHFPQHTKPSPLSIRDVELRGIRHQQPTSINPNSSQINRGIQIVICQIHEILPGHCLIQIRGSLLRARETLIHGTERRLPDMRELIENVWDGGLVGVVVHEDDGALVAENHFGERGPLGAVLRDVGGFVDVFEDAGVGDRGDEFVDGDVVGVDDQDGDDVVGVVVEPFFDGGERVFVGAGVEEVARGVAVPEGVVYVVDFSRD